MANRWIMSISAVIALGIFSPLLSAQTAGPNGTAGEAKPKWNNVPPPRSAYAGKKATGEIPRRDLSGIWDSGQVLGTSGAVEHVALFPGGKGQEGGHEDETGI